MAVLLVLRKTWPIPSSLTDQKLCLTALLVQQRWIGVYIILLL